MRWIKVKKEKEICMIGKYPFIEGGVSGRHTECKALAERGDEVHILTVLKMSSGTRPLLAFLQQACVDYKSFVARAYFYDCLGGCRSASGRSIPSSDPLEPRVSPVGRR